MVNHKFKCVASVTVLSALLAGCSNSGNPPVVSDEKTLEKEDQTLGESSQSTSKEDSNPDSGDSKENSSTEEKTKSVGDYEVTMKSASTLNVSGPFTPNAGNVFVVTVLEIKNNSDQMAEISSGSNFAATADGSDIYQAWTVDPEGIQWIDGTVNPGQTIEGCVCFEAPEDFTELKVDFYPDIMESDVATFTITH